VDSVPDVVPPGIESGTSGSATRNSDDWTTEADRDGNYTSYK
jgi:hypothetical protein